MLTKVSSFVLKPAIFHLAALVALPAGVNKIAGVICLFGSLACATMLIMAAVNGHRNQDFSGVKTAMLSSGAAALAFAIVGYMFTAAGFGQTIDPGL